MHHLSNRINAIEESATLAMSAKAREYKNRGIDVINLSLGEPDFKTPQHICDAAKAAIDDGKYFSYPPVAGYQDLREAIATKYQKENKVPYKAENIVVSNGAKQSIANVMLALLNPGDEVIVFAPYWVSYDALVRLTEATPVIINGTLENDFKVTAQQVEQAITTKTKAIIFSSPCNPTGSVFSKKELESIAAVVLSHENLLIIADEIYEHINFTGDQTSMASLPGMFDRTITVNGFAKGLDLFWRDGTSIKNLEYWFSYSYIDTERDYKNFSSQVTPSFVADHSLSIVTKYFITNWKSQIGFTNSYSSGRPYNNLNELKFMNGKTKSYNSLSFNWAYLLSQQKILYFSVSNILGTQNVFGYEYANNPDSTGFYKRKEIIPTADRFFFVGFFWTISNDKKDNQLRNL